MVEYCFLVLKRLSFAFRRSWWFFVASSWCRGYLPEQLRLPVLHHLNSTTIQFRPFKRYHVLYLLPSTLSAQSQLKDDHKCKGASAKFEGMPQNHFAASPGRPTRWSPNRRIGDLEEKRSLLSAATSLFQFNNLAKLPVKQIRYRPI